MGGGKRLITGILAGILMMGMSLPAFAEEQKTMGTGAEYLYSLKYDPNTVLVRKSTGVENFVPKTGTLGDNDKFVVVTREHKTLENGTADLAVMDGNVNRVYPGALVRVDGNLADNRPTILVTDQKPITISVDLPGAGATGEKSSHTQVENPNLSTVQQAANGLLDNWLSQEGYTVPAKMQYTYTMAYSREQLQAVFGASFDPSSLNIDFEAVASGEKQVAVANFRQIYYNVRVDPFAGPKDIVQDSVTKKELQEYMGITDETPLGYVSSVTYGRSIYVKLETTSRSTRVKEAFEGVIESKGVTVSNNAELKSIVNQSSFSAFVYGGSASEGAKVISGKLSDLHEVIKADSNFSKSNPGAPIAYTVSFAKDNAPAKVNSTADYIETSCASYPSGKLFIENDAWVTVKVHADWNVVSYDKDGKEILKHVVWSDSGCHLALGDDAHIDLPGNVRNLHVHIKYFKAAKKLRNLYEKWNLPLVPKRTLEISGNIWTIKVKDIVN